MILGDTDGKWEAPCRHRLKGSRCAGRRAQAAHDPAHRGGEGRGERGPEEGRAELETLGHVLHTQAPLDFIIKAVLFVSFGRSWAHLDASAAADAAGRAAARKHGREGSRAVRRAPGQEMGWGICRKCQPVLPKLTPNPPTPHHHRTHQPPPSYAPTPTGRIFSEIPHFGGVLPKLTKKSPLPTTTTTQRTNHHHLTRQPPSITGIPRTPPFGRTVASTSGPVALRVGETRRKSEGAGRPFGCTPSGVANPRSPSCSCTLTWQASARRGGGPPRPTATHGTAHRAGVGAAEPRAAGRIRRGARRRRRGGGGGGRCGRRRGRGGGRAPAHTALLLWGGGGGQDTRHSKQKCPVPPALGGGGSGRRAPDCRCPPPADVAREDAADRVRAAARTAAAVAAVQAPAEQKLPLNPAAPGNIFLASRGLTRWTMARAASDLSKTQRLAR
eukprot:gene11256-biopygen12390